MDIRLAVAWVTLAIIAVIAASVLWLIVTGRIDLTRLISEPTGDASISRFQLLIFTFVVALSLFLIVASGTPPVFPDVPGGVLTLLGISASSYVVSKSIQFSKPEGIEDRPPHVTVAPASVTLSAGQKREFTAEVERTQNSSVKWGILPPGLGTIDASSGVYTAPAVIPPAGAIVTIQAVSVASATGVGTAVINLVP